MQPINQKAMSPLMMDTIKKSGIVAVLVIDDEKHTLPLANALLKGGVTAIELTLRTPAALKAAEIIKKEVPELTLGIGTVLTTQQVEAIAGLGVDFAVAPGCNPNIINAAQKNNLSFAPGITTASELETAVELGCRMLKYFPAEPIGGINYLKNMVAPYEYLGLSFIPLGGLNISNAENYLKSGLIAAIGGSWVAKRSLIVNEQWETITNNALEIRNLIDKIRSE